MANDENLTMKGKAITSTEQAQELGRKGGKSRSLAKKLINRQFCSSSCPLWNTCWAKHISQTNYEKSYNEGSIAGVSEGILKKLKPKCALKNMPTQVIERAKRITMGGEEGFNQEMMEQLIRYGNDVLLSPKVKDRENYLYQLREVKKSIYGDKSRIDGNIKTDRFTAADFREAYLAAEKNREQDDVELEE